jgi:D-sedoheptulose 7-phosphate isomerase
VNAYRDLGEGHLSALSDALSSFRSAVDVTSRWGQTLADSLLSGRRLLAAGNGGSAAQAQHLTAEIVGRYCHERPGFSAVALHAEPAALTAILNDYGPEEVFARQVRAHGRPGDICVLMSTSGRSPNIVSAARTARQCGLVTWAFTGCLPNPLAGLADDCLAVDSTLTATVQELHLVALHMVCEAMDRRLELLAAEAAAADRSMAAAS